MVRVKFILKLLFTVNKNWIKITKMKMNNYRSIEKRSNFGT